MITCYALLRKVGSNLYLSPYLDPEKVALMEKDTSVVLKSSGMLTKAQKDEASFSLYSAIDFSVDRWIQDKQYIPRLLICAVVFMVTYFFMSLAIRDPIPMVDETLGSTGLTIFCWVMLAKRDTRSSLALERRYELKGAAGSPDYQQQEELFALETFLQDIASLDLHDVCDTLCLVTKEPFVLLSDDQKGPWAKEFLELLELHLKIRQGNLWRYYRNLRSVRASGRAHIKLSQRLFHLAMQQKLDLPLLALVVALSEQAG
ncbi:hypothetical protein [Sphaerochaeta sp. PS]|uniref:hypothetical protein n=1 Tax=Sphaerochaeta sp. PS TaxID=3076336 RepID=UPI0028A3BE3A|nr:hypothetical protein [Sphaerochaeta sp. PS]MDT4762351.1 hypothetical protein [Sphaerochaeta sp. PS]